MKRGVVHLERGDGEVAVGGDRCGESGNRSIDQLSVEKPPNQGSDAAPPSDPEEVGKEGEEEGQRKREKGRSDADPEADACEESRVLIMSIIS